MNCQILFIVCVFLERDADLFFRLGTEHNFRLVVNIILDIITRNFSMEYESIDLLNCALCLWLKY